MIRAKYSTTYAAKMARIRRLPVLLPEAVETWAKYVAEELVRRFHDGIKYDRLGLEPLRPRTISRKAALGYDRPGTPLYGMGDSEAERSYINMLRIRKAGRKYTVAPSRAMHWDRKVSLKRLFEVHEYGATITDGFGKGIFIRIPPRPALRKAYGSLVRWMSRREPAKEVRARMAAYVRGSGQARLADVKPTGEYDE
jgi:hypothetical protein